jgi:hypothetical protein
MAHPTRPCITLSQKKIGPCLWLWARGSPAFRFFRLPRDRGGWRADRAHGPDYSGRVVRIAPDDEVHLQCTPRLAARQRGILAFMPLTVVGPGRVVSARRGCPSTARGRRLRKSFARRCRSRSPPTERLRKAPLETWIGMARHRPERLHCQGIVFTHKKAQSAPVGTSPVTPSCHQAASGYRQDWDASSGNRAES